MNETMNRLARELADAIAAAVSASPLVEACRDRARAAGFELQVSLEATVGFATKASEEGQKEPVKKTKSPRRAFELSGNDRRFLRSLRIAPDEAIGQVERGKEP